MIENSSNPLITDNVTMIRHETETAKWDFNSIHNTVHTLLIFFYTVTSLNVLREKGLLSVLAHLHDLIKHGTEPLVFTAAINEFYSKNHYQ